MDQELDYTITEKLHRNRAGQVVRIDFEFEETVTVEGAAPSLGGTMMQRTTREKKSRTYDTSVTRNQYQMIASRLKEPLSFDEFINVLRPFIMGFYAASDLERAFHILDRDHSGTIHIDELASFLPLLNDAVDNITLRSYVRKVDENFDGTMNYNEFRTLVLRGMGRDIICNHL